MKCNKKLPLFIYGCYVLLMKELEKSPPFTVKMAEVSGISRRMLSYYVKQGALRRIGKGLYQGIHYQDDKHMAWRGLAIAAGSIHRGVICLISALTYYQLTDSLMDEYWIAIPHGNTKSKIPNIKCISMRNIELGMKNIALAGIKVRIFDRERTIVDTFRLLDIETALMALKIYMSGEGGNPNIRKIYAYSKELRQDISKYLMPFTI